MADSDIAWAHADAIHSMLTAAVAGWNIYLDEPIPDSADRYLKIWPPPVVRPVTTLAGYGGEGRTTTQVTAAGRSIREVITALDRCGAALHRRRPTIVGRRCSLISQAQDVPDTPRPDPDVRTADGQPILFSFLSFSLFSAPADTTS
jgi:hypothetical protein